jgi:NAD(P)-dependent dehydrogenase (short-subunit alcohol dehydrogenase family)
MNRLDGKTALVTGAARGIGEAIVRAFVAEGATVWATDIDEACGRDAAAKAGARFLPLDVRDEGGWAEVIGRVGPLDILVNNAGVTGFQGGPRPHDPEHAALEDWRAVHATNLDGTFLGCKYAIRAMRANGGGSIINMSSRSGLVGIPGAAAYASSKAGVRNHSKTVATYCAREGLGIRCNSIHPAVVLTPMWDDVVGTGPDREARLAALVAETPLRRAGTVEEVAALAVYLAADESAYVTGSEFNIDGGLLAGAAASPK